MFVFLNIQDKKLNEIIKMKAYLCILMIFLLFAAAHYFASNQTKQTICKLPDGCRYTTVYVLSHFDASEYFTSFGYEGLRCEIRDNNYRFDFESKSNEFESGMCALPGFTRTFEINVVTHKNILFAKSFNLKSALDFYFRLNMYCIMKLSFLKSIHADLGIESDKSWTLDDCKKANIEIFSSRFDFFVNEMRVARSCQEYVDANLTTPRSIFQIFVKRKMRLDLINNVYKNRLCPLLFKNARINLLYISGMSNHFFRQNVLSFNSIHENETLLDDLNSSIRELGLYRTENIALDKNFLNPYVFKKITEIVTYEIISRIENDIFSYFKELKSFQSEAHYFRRLIHKQGVEWMRALNSHLSVNMSDPTDIKRNKNNEKSVKLRFTDGRNIEQEILDQDFCLYVNFPFEQLVTFEFRDANSRFVINTHKFEPANWTNRLTCTAWWLIQYFPFIQVVYNKNNSDFQNIYSRLIPKRCNFTTMLDRCKKNNWVMFKNNIISIIVIFKSIL